MSLALARALYSLAQGAWPICRADLKPNQKPKPSATGTSDTTALWC